MGKEGPNIEKELDDATALYAKLMASIPAEHPFQGPLCKHVLHVEPEPLIYGNVCRSAHRQLREKVVRTPRTSREEDPSKFTPPKGVDQCDPTRVSRRRRIRL